MTMLQEDHKYRVGKEATQYTSIYGYQKRRYPVFDVTDPDNELFVGDIKQEIVKNTAGELCEPVYYTRDFERPNEGLRFFNSPEALILAFGGQIKKHGGRQKEREYDVPRLVNIAS